MTDNYYIIVKFKSNKIAQGQDLSAAVLRVTAYNSKAEARPDIRIYGYKGGSIPDPTDTLIGVWDNNDTTKNFERPVSLGENWTAGNEYPLTTGDGDTILEVIQEIIDDTGFDGDFGIRFNPSSGAGGVDIEIYTIDSGDSNDGKYMELDLTLDKTGFPFWIDCKLVKKPHTNNNWFATIEIEARWSL